MNQTLRELRAIADRERAVLPEVTDQDLEKSGALFYMNGQNGTEFDWYVNDRLSSFMVFYNDEANRGAVKLYLNRSATADVFLYGEQGKKFLKQVTVPVEPRSRSYWNWLFSCGARRTTSGCGMPTSRR